MVTEKMIEALKPLADAVFNDNGDMTVQLPAITSEDCIKAYFAVRELAALSTDAEPVAWQAQGDDGTWRYVEMPRTAACMGMSTRPLYAAPPAPAVTVRALEWKEDGKYLRARMGDREYSINITADGETWAGATRPYVFGKNLTWSSVPNCSMVSLESAKAACQADCQSRYAALSAQVQDVQVPDRWKLVPDDATDAMVEAAANVDWSNENEMATVHNVWHAMLAAAPAAKLEEKP